MGADGLAATTSLPGPAPAIPAGKLVAWAVLVGSLIALSYAANAAALIASVIFGGGSL